MAGPKPIPFHFNLSPEKDKPFFDALAQALPSAATRAELGAVLGGGRRDPFFYREMLEFGRRLQSQQKPEMALELYAWLGSESQAPEELKQAALRESEALQGKGPFGGRAEVLLKQVVQDSSDGRVILPMLGASVVGSLSKAMTMGRLLRAPAALYSRGSGARLMTTSAGFAAEGLAFAGFGRAMHGPAQSSWGEDIARSYVGLGALKFSGWLGRGLMPIPSASSPALMRCQAQALPQLTIFTGLLLAHRLETQFGLRPETNSDHLVADTIAAMISLQVGTRMGHGLLGKKFHRFQQEMELAARSGPDRFGTGRPHVSKFGFLKNGFSSAVTPEGIGFPGISLREGVWVAKAREVRSAELAKSSPPPPPESLLQDFGKHYERVYGKLEEVFAQVPQELAERYLAELEIVERRKTHWIKQVEQLAETQGEERVRFEQDIAMGLSLLRERLLRVGAEIFQEPLEAARRPRWGLRFKPDQEAAETPNRPKPEPGAGPRAKPAEGALEALVNQDVGYGQGLSLRAHQIAALHAVRGRLRLLQAFIQAGETPPAEALVGTIVMPVGGGKTRTMVAGFAAGLELGWVDPKAGDKCVILNHTDQIHGQNLQVAELLSGYFKKRTGRALRISEYKAEQKDLSGDVIVVSIPSIAEPGRRQAFQESLKKSLGDQGKVAMVAVDEVHHLGLGQGKSRETWAQAIQSIRDISPQAFEIGFTATPTGKEAGRIFTVRERELMQAGVTPRTYLVKVDGIDLSQLKVAQGGEFEGRALQSTLLGHPERNERIYAALAERGMRAKEPSPSGKPKLEPVLVFGQDLKHAEAMAGDYVQHFAKPSGDLGNRRFIILGKDRGKITSKELESALSQYRTGQVDGIVALVSGMTEGRKDPVLQAVTRGEIEAVFTVDALVEGADLYMFSHQVGARPTFSRFKKGQERGRINRRGPEEVSPEGQLIKDPPKILFDVMDRYYGEIPLMNYGNIMGILGHAQLKNGEMLDALSGERAETVDREGKDIRRRPPGPIPPAAPKLKKIDSDWAPLIEQLGKLLEEQYRGDLESLALDLGETESFVAELLEGRGWEPNRWFLRRLGTLLYQERQSFFRLYREPYLAAFRQALAQIEAEQKLVSYMAVADLAWRLYGEGLSEAERPGQSTFRSLVSGKRADPEVMKLLAASEWVSKRTQTDLDPAKVSSAFRQALARIEAEKQMVSYTAVADLAWRLYGEGLPEAERSSQYTFRNSVSGKKADPELLRLLAASEWVIKQTSLDYTKVSSAFRQALAQIEAEKQMVSYTAVADLAWRLYGEGLPEAERPGQSTFRKLVSGKEADPELLRLLAASEWMSKQTQTALDPARVSFAFRQALARIEAEQKLVSYQAVASLAWRLYGEGLPEAERPSPGTFRGLVSGKKADPEVLRLLAASEWVIKQTHTALDPAKASSAFRQALAQIEAEQKFVSYTAVADLARRLYGEGLPEAERPSQGTFRGLVSGKKADPELLRLLAASEWVSKQTQTALDPTRVSSAFRQALAQIEAEQKLVSYQAVADLAWRLYGEGLPEGERPSQGTFRSLVSGKEADPELLRLLAASNRVQKRNSGL